ncbi:HNH endonuclease [Streptomyces sp. S1A]|uniref:HNH endonuclease signature motif containing protein n=1 Tax=Streptomyces sp. ICN903 TaxID=2964654 RepID=UPI001EDC6445|nr:HNH endonuclease [Streptomyces sp. ICN903]MCG3044053.1 HNH endonuclease [Streptomyces sp. ICN903]
MSYCRLGYTRQKLTTVAAEAASPVDMLRRMGQPLNTVSLRYLRSRLSHYEIDTSHFTDESLPPSSRTDYTSTVLEDAAVRSSSLHEMAEYLGVRPYSSLFGHLRRRLAHFGIDTSHFAEAHGGRSSTIDEQTLRLAVSESSSIAQVVRALGLSVSGASRARVKKAIRAYGLSTSHFTGQAHYRNRPSPHRKSADEILRRLEPGSPRARRSLLHRALQEKGVPYACRECGTGPLWRGRKLVLEIDHVNGDRLDNRIGNLRYLCPSCHSQTRTFADGSRR